MSDSNTAKNEAPIEPSNEEKLKGLEWWKRSMRYRVGLGLTDEDKKQYELDYQVKNGPEDCKKCFEYRDWMMKYSPSVRFMLEHLHELGGNLGSSNIICDQCNDLKGGGFNPEMGILLCSNWIKNKWQLEDILTHELVHAYDHLRFKVDLSNLKHHACTEIRASMLSGECRILNEITKTGLGDFGKKFQSCIRRRAILSVTANPNCSGPEEAEKAVNTVWLSCFNDTRPFERVYR